MTSDICALVGELHIVYQYDETCTVTMDQDGVLVEYKVFISIPIGILDMYRVLKKFLLYMFELIIFSS